MHKIVNGQKIDLTPEEIKEFQEREAQLQKEQAELKKTEYLRLRKNDPDMPSLEDKVDAIYESLAMKDDSKFNEIKKKIEEVKLKYPKPE